MKADAPESLWLVESLLNSIDVEGRQDDLESLPRFRRWLRDHGRAEAAQVATEADLALVRQVRDELRAELAARHDGVPRDHSSLDALVAGVALAARFPPEGGVRLAPMETGVHGVLGEVLAAVVRAGFEGTWPRLKICSSDACRFVYYDRSKNAARRWCSMDVCGNRSKTKAYRQRRRA